MLEHPVNYELGTSELWAYCEGEAMYWPGTTKDDGGMGEYEPEDVIGEKH